MNLIVEKRGVNWPWTIFFILCVFQRPLTNLFPSVPFNYVDDAATLFFFIYIVKYSFSYLQLCRDFKKMLFCIFAIILIGSMCSYMSNVKQSFYVQVLDVIFLTKVFICFIGSNLYFSRRNIISNISIFNKLTKVVKLVVLAAILMYPLVYFGIDWLYNSERYGLRCYNFIYGSAGMFSQYCICFFIVLTSSFAFHKQLRFIDLFYLHGLLFIWGMSIRSRAVMIIFVFLALLFLARQNKGLSAKQFLKKVLTTKYILPITAVSLYLTIDQIIHYYDTEDQARSMLLYGGISIFSDYFPWGAGWATYGTEPAANFYSPLYNIYGLDTHWALGEGGSELTDNYWPSIMAELGLFGLIVMAYLIYLMSKVILNKCVYDRWVMLAMLTYVIFLLVSSTATHVYSSPTTTNFIIITGLILNCNKNR